MSRLRNCSLALLFVSALAVFTVLSRPVESVSVDVSVRQETDALDSLVMSPAASMRFAQVATMRGSDSDEDSEESSEESSESGRRKKRSRKGKKAKKSNKSESSVSKSKSNSSSGSKSKSESSRSRSESSRSRSEASSRSRSESARSKSEGSSRSGSSQKSSGSSSRSSSGSSTRSSSGSSTRSSGSSRSESGRSESSRRSSSGSGSGSSRSESSRHSGSGSGSSSRSESSRHSSRSGSRSESSRHSSGSESSRHSSLSRSEASRRSESSLRSSSRSEGSSRSESANPFASSSSSASRRSESSRSRSESSGRSRSEGSSRSESSRSRSESSSRSRSESIRRWENSAAGRRLSTKSRESVSSISEQAEEASAEESSLASKLLNGSFAEQVAGTINGLAQVIDKVYQQVQQDEVVFKTFKNKMLEDEIAKAVPDYNWPAIEKLVKAEVQVGKVRIENQVSNFKIDVLDTVQKGLDQLRADVRDTTTTDPSVAHGENSEESSRESSESSSKVGTYDKYPYGVKHPPSNRKKRHSESSEDGLSSDVLKRLKFSENTDQGPAEFETHDLFGTLPSTPLDAISKSLDHLVAKTDKEAIYHFILNTIAARRKTQAEKKKAESKYGETATKALEDLRRQLTGKIPAHEIGSEIFERLEDLTRDQLRHPSNDTAEALKQIQQTLIQALRKKEINDLHNEDSEESTESTRRHKKAGGVTGAESSESAMRARLRRLKEAASKKLGSNISSVKKLAKDTLAMQRRMRDKESSSSSKDLNVKHVPLPDAVSNLEKVWQDSKRAIMASRGAASMAAQMAKEARDHADVLRSTTASQLNKFAKSESSRSESSKAESTTQNVEAEDVTRYRHHRAPEPSAPRPVAPPAQLPALESIVAEHEKLLQRLGRPMTWEEKQIKNKLDLIKKNFTVVPEVRNGLEHKVLPAVKDRNPSRPQQTWALRGVEVVDSIAPDAVIESSPFSSASSSSESSSRLVNGRQPIILTAP